MEHYLDNSATTKVCPEAAQAALAAMTECYGNPSSTHTRGREAKKLLDTARGQAAAALGCRPGGRWFSPPAAQKATTGRFSRGGGHGAEGPAHNLLIRGA